MSELTVLDFVFLALVAGLPFVILGIFFILCAPMFIIEMIMDRKLKREKV